MKRIRLTGINTELLQSFRLMHALAEAGIPLAINRRQVPAWKWLSTYFGEFDAKPSSIARKFSDVEVDHHSPGTRIGSAQRPLVFAHQIVNRCLAKWDDRSNVITFAGKMTDQRRNGLRPLVEFFGRDFLIDSTDAGRVWPSKAWDDEYHTRLGQSQLTACPNGDFVWTYRFFEATLCGSIPVIQDECVHYEGFNYYRIGDPGRIMTWRQDWAERNQAIARTRLTIPHSALVAALS